MNRTIPGLIVILFAIPAAAAGAEIRHLEVEKHDRRYTVQSDTYIDAPVQAVFDVLTDYDRFERISSVFEESRFLERDDDGGGVVYTRARGCVVFFCRSVERVETLEVEPVSRIVATVIPERSDTLYSRARWRLTPEGTGTHIHYELEMEPSFWVPPVIGPMLLKQRLRSGGERAAERIERIARGDGAS